jgi:hypothetical protein
MRALKILVSVMGVLIVVATVALVVLVIQRMNRAAQGPGSNVDAVLTTTNLALRQPAGSRVGGIAALEGQLAIWVERPDGGRVLLVDPRSLRQTGEIRLGE